MVQSSEVDEVGLSEFTPLTAEVNPTISNDASNAPYYGPYTTGPGSAFWQGDETDETLAERLKKTEQSIKTGLEKGLTPEFWERVSALLDQAQGETGEAITIEGNEKLQEGKEKEAEASIVKVSARRGATRSTRSTKAEEAKKPTGEEAGRAFVEAVTIEPIAGTAPTVEILPEASKRYTPAELPPLEGKDGSEPGYVLNMPAHVSKSVDAILNLYGAEATKGAPDLPARMAAVIGINDLIPLENEDESIVSKAVNRVSAKTRFRYGVFGFLWAPTFNVEGEKGFSIDEVIELYRPLDNAAKKFVRENLYKGRLRQKQLAYGMFREQVTKHEYVNTFINELGEVCDPVYLHIGDPDAVSWVVNNDASVGILARYDQAIGEMDKQNPEAIRPPMIVGGYNFGVPTAQDDPINALCKVGNILDRAIRRSIAAIVPEALYATEPNLLVKVLDKNEGDRARQWKLMQTLLKQPGRLFGKGDAEGNTLKLALAEILKMERSDPVFAPYVDATIETDIPPRVIKSASSHPKQILLNLLRQKQSYATTANWAGIGRLDKGETKGEPEAKTYVDNSMREIIADLIEEARKRRASSQQRTSGPTFGGMGQMTGGFMSGSSGGFSSQSTSNLYGGSMTSGGSSMQTSFASSRSGMMTVEEQQMRAVKQESFELRAEKSGLTNYMKLHNASDKEDNCLIYSVANALGKKPVEDQINNIRKTGKGMEKNGYLNTDAIPTIMEELEANAEVVLLSTEIEGKDGWFPAQFFNEGGTPRIFLVNAANVHFGWAELLSGVKEARMRFDVPGIKFSRS
jgi:hypothetical protein